MKSLIFCLGVIILSVNSYAAKVTFAVDVGVGTYSTATADSSWAHALPNLDSVFTYAVSNPTVGLTVYYRNTLGTVDTIHRNYDWNTRDAKTDSMFQIIGVKSSTTREGSNILRSDFADTLGIKPAFYSAYTFTNGDCTKFAYLKMFLLAPSTNSIVTNTGFVLSNCDIEVLNTPTARNVISGGGEYVHNRIYCPNIGFLSASAGTTSMYNTYIGVLGAYSIGVTIATSNFNSIFDLYYGFKYACKSNAAATSKYYNCTFTNDSNAIYNTGATPGVAIRNCIFNKCFTFGLYSQNRYDNTVQDHNLYYLCGTNISGADLTGPYADPHKIEADPLFVNESGMDFRLTPTSPAKGSGLVAP